MSYEQLKFVFKYKQRKFKKKHFMSLKALSHQDLKEITPKNYDHKNSYYYIILQSFIIALNT